MKKYIAAIIFLSLAAAAFSGGVDTKSNQSTGYLRNPSRNTENKRAEAALYNIAGTAFLSDGLYLNAGDQLIFKRYSNELEGEEYTDNALVYAFPNAEAVYKSGKLSFFGTFAVYGGGGMLEYNDGSAMTWGLLAKGAKAAYQKAENQTKNKEKYALYASALQNAMNNHELSVYSAVFGEQIGIGFDINEKWGVGACVRILQGQQDVTLSCSNSDFIKANGEEDLSYRSRGWGYAFVIGVHSKPIEGVDLSAQYQTKASMKYEYTNVDGNLSSLLGFEEGGKYSNDLPAVLNFGAGWQALDNLYASASFNVYFDKDAKHNSNGTSIDYNNSWEVALGAEYEITDSISVSLGTLYNRTGSTSSANNIVNPALDCISAGTGAEVEMIKNLWLEAGFMYSYYFEKDYDMESYEVTLNKRVPFVSLGVSFKPF